MVSGVEGWGERVTGITYSVHGFVGVVSRLWASASKTRHQSDGGLSEWPCGDKY